MTLRRTLYNGLSRRESPEEVGREVIDLLGLSPTQGGLFPKRPSWHGYWKSSMSEDWDKVADLSKPLGVLEALTGFAAPAADNPALVRGYLDLARSDIVMQPGKTSFKHDRLDRKGRTASGVLNMSRRRYDKLFRLIGRLDVAVGEMETQQALARLARFAKIGFSADVPYSAFKQTDTTAAFIAYHTANLARRSLFIAGPQARAFDAAAKFLFERAEGEADTSWYAIAHTFPRDDVLHRLSVEQRADLLDKARAVLDETATLLGALADRSEGMDLDQMIVKRGNDSSTWNALAGAWNKARDLWIAVAWSLDPTLLDAFLPGKVLRLMAADVAAWHRSLRGGGLDPDTKVWAALPRPWAVFRGEATCGRVEVIAACVANGVDPAQGWAKPRPRTSIAPVVATPESVHGVVVSHPQLAELLRKAGWFSGYENRVREVAPILAAAGMAEREAHWLAHNEEDF